MRKTLAVLLLGGAMSAPLYAAPAPEGEATPVVDEASEIVGEPAGPQAASFTRRLNLTTLVTAVSLASAVGVIAGEVSDSTDSTSTTGTTSTN